MSHQTTLHHLLARLDAALLAHALTTAFARIAPTRHPPSTAGGWR